ncbi:probable glutathione S-transferase [Ricinus communis]|uniref:Glutathione-dependent dehydroascorbate reductase n=1 Tax=Ricinus communis TaxID=3988 RepID=B9RWR6_RICCO|nr:probable glutathione S-transferase [Ricinus communis]EEF44318.1 glutathione s-transferase, putative [Ricinus communis]|eukprot:XP_002518185.1 probable glutathione S-transferase [Ricinus communis]
MGEFKLLGGWSSPYSHRVLWALKLKGIPYKYIEEEDLSNKSPLLLQYNPVHRKIPVLLHGGKPICESMVIIEYLDEIWPENRLLPIDPYERAVARFWVNFVEDDKIPAEWRVFCSSNGEEQEKAVKDCLEMLKTIEEQALGENKIFFGGDRIGAVDIVCGKFVRWLEVIEEVMGIKLLQQHKFPRLYQWTINFKEAPIIKDNLPDHGKLLNLLKQIRARILQASVIN